MPMTYARFWGFLLLLVMLTARAENLPAKDTGELVFVRRQENTNEASRNNPGSRFSFELGKLLASRMGRSVRFIDLPRKRMTITLESGEGDIACGYTPAWLAGDLDWSKPFIPEEQVIVAAPGVARPASLAALKGKRIGTVLGFVYPELEQALGQDFVRDDAVSAEASLRKLLAGRFDYMVATQAMIQSRMKRGEAPASLNLLTVKKTFTQCALSRRGRIDLETLNRAIDAIVRSGDLARIAQRTR